MADQQGALFPTRREITPFPLKVAQNLGTKDFRSGLP